MTRSRPRAGDLRWGWRCPRCDSDVNVGRNSQADTFYWTCEDVDCPSVGIGFRSRRQARLGVLEYRERYQDLYR